MSHTFSTPPNRARRTHEKPTFRTMAGVTWLLFCSAALTGCVDLVPTLHPIYRNHDVIFEPALLGSWSGDPSRDGDTWEFREGPGASYRLLVVDGGEDSTRLEAHLVRIGGHLYLDLVPEAEGRDANLTECFSIPAHAFARVDRIEPDLVVSLPDVETFEAYARAHANEIDVRTVGARSVIVSPPSRIRAFLARYARVEGSFVPFQPRVRIAAIGSAERTLENPTSGSGRRPAPAPPGEAP